MKKLLALAISCSLLLSACTPRDVKLAHHCLSSTVLIHMKVAKGKKRGMGTCSGVYVSPNQILTANHCVDLSDAPGVTLKEIWIGNYNGDSARATIVRTDPTRDLALLKTDLKGSPAKLGSDVKVGQDVWCVGNPLGYNFIVTKGIVSQVDMDFEAFPTDHFMTDATVLPGNSGGPAFNSRGQLVGIVVMSTSMIGMFGASGLGVVVQTNEVRHFLTHK